MGSRSNFCIFLSGVIITSLVHYLGSLYSLSFTRERNNNHIPLISTDITFQPRRCVVFGDSITQFGYAINGRAGWVARLGEWWSRKVDIINRGYSGYNTKWALKIFNEVILSLKPNFVIIFYGANDAAIESSVQYVPLTVYQQNLITFVQRIQETLPDAKILLITPPPIHEDKLRKFNFEKDKGNVVDRMNERTSEYVKIVHRIGLQFNLPVVDAFVGMEGTSPHVEDRSQYLIDGIHLNELGNDRLYELITEKISSYYPAWTPNELPYPVKPWKEAAVES